MKLLDNISASFASVTLKSNVLDVEKRVDDARLALGRVSISGIKKENKQAQWLPVPESPLSPTRTAVGYLIVVAFFAKSWT